MGLDFRAELPTAALVKSVTPASRIEAAKRPLSRRVRIQAERLAGVVHEGPFLPFCLEAVPALGAGIDVHAEGLDRSYGGHHIFGVKAAGQNDGDLRIYPATTNFELWL